MGQPTSHVEKIGGVVVTASQLFDLILDFQDAPDRQGGVGNVGQSARQLVRGQDAAQYAEVTAQQIQGPKLRYECLGCANADFRTRVQVECGVGGARKFASHRIDQCHDRRPVSSCTLHSQQHIGRGTRL